MKRYLLLAALLIAELPGCAYQPYHPGSQRVRFGLWGWDAPDEESFRLLREAKGNKWAYPY